MVNDKVWAKAVLDLEEAGVELPFDTEEEAPPVEGYSPVMSRLDLIADRVLAVRTAVQANYTKNHEEPRFDPMKRPVSAIERERDERARTVLHEVDALVFGGGLVIDG